MLRAGNLSNSKQ